MRVVIGSDHHGVGRKEIAIELLEAWGHSVVLLDHSTDEPVDYPDIAFEACQQIVKNNADRGILICGSGVGMSIAANKVDGIRSTICSDATTAELIRKHNNTNVVCFAGEFVESAQFADVLKIWIDTPFGGKGEERHERRVAKIAEIEQKNTCNHG